MPPSSIVSPLFRPTPAPPGGSFHACVLYIVHQPYYTGMTALYRYKLTFPAQCFNSGKIFTESTGQIYSAVRGLCFVSLHQLGP